MRVEILRRPVCPSLKRPAPHRRVVFALPRRLLARRLILKVPFDRMPQQRP